MSGTIERDILSTAKKTTTVGTGLIAVIGPVNLLRYDKKTFTLKNTGATALSAAQVQATSVEVKDPVDGRIAPSTSDADWETIDSTTFATLAGAGIKSLQITDDSRKWWRVLARVAAATTTIDGYVTAGTP